MEIFNIILGLGTVILFLAAVSIPFIYKSELFKKYSLPFCMSVTLGAALGSLIYSHVFYFEPCLLCWYQRIFIFPIPVILLTAYAYKIKDIWRLTFSLSIIGLLISLYHILIQTTSTPSVFCEPGSIDSCSNVDIVVLGFITIPMMSFTILLFTALCSYFSIKNNHRNSL